MIEVQDIFNQYGDAYRKKHQLPYHLLKTMSHIESCRTSKLGGHVDKCDSCGNIRISYNSCRNRHCPKCQTLAKERWLYDRKRDLLPVGYFHVVFTIPKEIEPIAIRNQKLVYDILLKSASETLLELAKDKKHLGAEIGFFSILHTWGQNLINHTHVHCVVPSGGLSLDGTTWINAKKTSEGNDFFIHVDVLGALFKKKFMDYLVKAYNNHQLKLVGEIKYLVEKNLFKCLRSNLYEKRWNVYCKAPFKSAENVLEYLGRYTHRVGISNDRIVHFENELVTFKWRDYKDNNKEKFMTVSAEEFIRRFLLHVLPHKYVKIRHYGILSNKNKKTKLALCRGLIGVKLSNNSVAKLTTAELILKITGLDINLCPCCKKGQLIFREKILPKAYSPPGKTKTIA